MRVWSTNIIPEGKSSALHLTSSGPVWIPLTGSVCTLFIARLLRPQLCCCLFLNSCYSRATVCVWNTKRCDWLSLIPSLTVGDCSHHRLTSIRRTVHTSLKCQPKSLLLFFFALSLGALPCRHNTQSVMLSVSSLALLASLSLIHLSSCHAFFFAWSLNLGSPTSSSTVEQSDHWVKPWGVSGRAAPSAFLKHRGRRRRHRSIWAVGLLSSALRLCLWPSSQSWTAWEWLT